MKNPTTIPTKNRPQNAGSSMDDNTGRLDAVAKVNGSAKYSRDRYMDNQLFAAFVRCPWGHASLESIDREAALAVDGVLEVNLDGTQTGRYHGQRIGYVVAESKTALRRGMTALKATWRRRSCATSILDGHDGTPEPSNVTQAVLKGSDHVLNARYETPVVTHSSLETHGAVIDHDGERAIAYISTQGTGAATQGLHEALDLPAARVEVDCEYVGGGFGSKLSGAGAEGMTAARIAAKHKRPVSLFVDRDEEHLDTGNRPSSMSDVMIGFNNDGTIVGGQIRTYGGSGIARGGGGVTFPSGRYELGKIDSERTQSIQFNGGGPRAFRAPGHPQGSFAEELMLDEIATKTGVDPLELRLRLDTEPARREMLEIAARKIGWDERKTTGTQTGVIRRGFGLGAASWGRFPAGAQAEVVIHRDASVEVRTGTQDIGTGMRTVAGVLAADMLGISLDHVHVRIGHSSLPPGPGSGGSMTAHNTAPVIMEAAEKARIDLMKRVADRDGGAVEEYDIVNGVVQRSGNDVMTFEQACAAMGADSLTGRGAQQGRRGGPRATYGGEGHSHGVQAVDLDVDIETGIIRVKHVIAVQACGRVVVRKTAESQIIGGVIQGLSYALFEDKRLDRNTGAMVNPNFEMYRILGPDDMPHIEPVLWTKGQTGVRSLGEPPIIPTAGAVAAAVLNAVGAPVRSLPLSASKVVAAVAASEKQARNSEMKKGAWA